MRKTILVLGLLSLTALQGLRGQTPEPTVHAVLFFSPTCGHCHQLINEHLIPMQERYGRALVILGMDTSQPRANNLYWETIRHFELPEEEWVVPMMVIGDEVLIGGITIPERLNRAMEEDLAAGGIDLPDYPPLVNLLREQDALDPRYPDRLIVRQAPPADDSVSQGAEDPVPADSAGPPIVMADVDTAGPGRTEGEEAVPDTSAPSSDTTTIDPPGAEHQEETVGPTRAGEVGEDAGDPQSGVATPSTQEEGVLEAQVPTEVAASAQEGLRQEAEAGLPEGLDLAETARSFESLGVWERFNLDPKGNSLSVLVLLAMLLSLALRGYPPWVRAQPWPNWVVPALVVVGAFVAAYLSFIEVTQTEAVCGPVGDCNTVNQSKYATLFGVLPVGVLGLVGYGLIAASWLVWMSSRGGPRRGAGLGLWLFSLLGTMFSIYLTFLEPFVIGATCIWCLTSAVVMTLLLWASAPLARAVWTDQSTSIEGA